MDRYRRNTVTPVTTISKATTPDISIQLSTRTNPAILFLLLALHRLMYRVVTLLAPNSLIIKDTVACNELLKMDSLAMLRIK